MPPGALRQHLPNDQAQVVAAHGCHAMPSILDRQPQVRSRLEVWYETFR